MDEEAEQAADETEGPEEAALRAEDLVLLRRELAFIGREYRTIVQAYYLEDKSIREIAKEQRLKEGTVKSRLFRAREKLKEGMNMARQFGKMSYRPENLSFMMNGMSGKNGEPWCFLERALDKNLLLAAYRTPSTAEELAVEVGVALPYTEEELDTLVRSTLMKKRENRYETDFFILNRDLQEELYAKERELAPAWTDAMVKILEYQKRYLNENCPGWYGGAQTEEDARWGGLMKTLDDVNRELFEEKKDHPALLTKGLGEWGHTKRPNDGEWDIVGCEIVQSAPYGTSLLGCVDSAEAKTLPAIDFYGYRFRLLGQKFFGMSLSYREAEIVKLIAEGREEQTDGGIRNHLIAQGILKEQNGKIVPAFRIVYRNNLTKMPNDTQKELDGLKEAAKEIVRSFAAFCREKIEKAAPDFLTDKAYQVEQAVTAQLFTRGFIVEEAVKRGYLTVPEDETRAKLLGLFLII